VPEQCSGYNPSIFLVVTSGSHVLEYTIQFTVAYNLNLRVSHANESVLLGQFRHQKKYFPAKMAEWYSD
jgi:hypothetical protein